MGLFLHLIRGRENRRKGLDMNKMMFRSSGEGLSGTAYPEQLTKCLKTGNANEFLSAGKNKLGVSPDGLRRDISGCNSLRSNSHSEGGD